MSLELKTVMGQMNIVGGRWVSEAPNALAVREPAGRLGGGPLARRPSSGKGDLFVVVEVRGNYEHSERDGLSRSLAETIRNTYYQSSGSITASLRRALLAANERLLAEYTRSPASAGRSSRRGEGKGSEHQSEQDSLLGGVTAVAVRGEDAFIASIGPAVTYAITRGIATRFPEASPWLDMPDPQATGAAALGRRTLIDAQLFHVWVEPGDILVLGDSRFAARTSPNHVEKAAAYQGVEGALTNLGKLTGGHDCTALVVEIQGKRAPVPASQAAPRSQDRQVPASPLRDQEKADVSDRAPQPRESLSVETASREHAAMSDPAPRVTVSQAGGGGVSALAGVGSAARRNLGRLPVGRWLGAIGKGLLALLMVIWAGLHTLIGRVLPGGEHEAPARRPAAAGQARRVQRPQIPQRILRTVALVILGVVLAAVGLVYWQQGLARENEFSNLVQQAQAAYQQALGVDGAPARDLLIQSETLLAQAETIKPDEPVIAELRGSIAEHQDKIDRVERLYWVGQLRTYDDSGTQLQRIVVSGLYVYVLDAGNDQVYRHQLDEVNDALQPDENDPVLVRRGQQVETSVIGEMIDMAWMPAGGERQTSDLLILESGGLLEYNPSWGVATVSIANKDAWALPVAVGSYFGNFYILDPQAGQILRYLPGAEGYTTPAEYYLSDEVSVDLAGAVDMAIDGFIYLLYADGTVRKFEAGAPVEFQITEIDKPLSRPTAIYTAPDDVAQYIYIADAGNRRVVQLNKDGRFMRQFKPRDEESVNFSTLRSISVDELTGKLYLLNDHALYIANITPLQ